MYFNYTSYDEEGLESLNIGFILTKAYHLQVDDSISFVKWTYSRFCYCQDE